MSSLFSILTGIVLILIALGDLLPIASLGIKSGMVKPPDGKPSPVGDPLDPDDDGSGQGPKPDPYV